MATQAPVAHAACTFIYVNITAVIIEKATATRLSHNTQHIYTSPYMPQHTCHTVHNILLHELYNYTHKYHLHTHHTKLPAHHTQITHTTHMYTTYIPYI